MSEWERHKALQLKKSTSERKKQEHWTRVQCRYKRVKACVCRRVVSEFCCMMYWRSHPLNGVTISGVERHVRTPADNTSIMHSFLAISVSPWEQTSLRDCNLFSNFLKSAVCMDYQSKCRLSKIELIFLFFLNLHKCETSQWSNCCPFSKSHWNRLTSGHFGHSKLLSMRTGLKN